MKKGDKVRMATTLSNGGVANYSAVVVIVDKDTVWLEIPARVRKLRFPPYDGKRYVQLPQAAITKAGATN